MSVLSQTLCTSYICQNFEPKFICAYIHNFSSMENTGDKQFTVYQTDEIYRILTSRKHRTR